MEQGIVVDLAKVAAVQDWERPKNEMDVRRFLGMVGYYKRFIKDLSKVATPLTNLTKKNRNFTWYAKCEYVFVGMKKKLTSTSVLLIPKSNVELTLYTDGSGIGLGAVLLQNGRVIAHGKQLQPHERRYLTHDLELATIVFSFKMWRNYLLRERFELFPDH